MGAEEALRSDAGFVLVDAAAGCGKTYSAAMYAREMTRQMPVGKRVLVLAHTNAAVEEFSSRTLDVGDKVEVSTFDALALRLIAPYAGGLGLPTPLRVGPGIDTVPFADLAGQAASLIARCPIVGDIMAEQYEVVVLDEHQDASRSQHAIAMELRRRSVKIRGFGDPMQTILPAVDGFGWPDIERDADIQEQLTSPHRWKEAPELGTWILDARRELSAGRTLPLATRPACVRLEQVAAGDIRFGAGNPVDYAGPVRRLPATGTIALLSARRLHAVTLKRAAVAGTAEIYEGSDFQHVYTALDRITASVGSPAEIGSIILSLVEDTCTGLTAARKARIDCSLRETFVPGRQHEVTPFLNLFAPLYREPDIGGAAETIRRILSQTPPWLRIERPAAFKLLGALSESDPIRVHDQMHEVVSAYKSQFSRPAYAASTVHRAKGLEFDNVLISNVSESHFEDTDIGRRLLYVALSRARRGLCILVPRTGASKLL